MESVRAICWLDRPAATSAALETSGYRTHEFGDSVLIEQQYTAVAVAAA